MSGQVEGLKAMKAELVACRFVVPEGGSRAVAEEAEADEHAGVVIQIKRGGGNLDSDCGNSSGGICREDPPCGFEEGEGGTAAEAEEVLQEGVGLEAEAFGNVAAQARAEVSGAGADEESIDG